MKRIDLNSIKTRLLLALIIVGVFLVGFMGLLSFKTFEDTLIDEIGSNRSDVLGQIGERVKQIRSNAYTLSNLYYYDESLQAAIREPKEGDSSYEKISNHLDMMTAQYKKSLYGSHVDFDVVLYTEHGYRYTSEHVGNDYEYMSPRTKIWYRDMLEAQGDIIEVANYKDKKRGINYFSLARAIMDDDGNPLAYLMLNINERLIYQMYEPVISDDSIIYIVDGEGTVMSSNLENLNGFQYFNMKNLKTLFGNEKYIITKMRNQEILFTKYDDNESGFTVLEDISLSSLLEPIQRVRLNVILAAVVAMFGVAVYACRFADKTTQPIKQLCDFMQQVEEENLGQKSSIHGFTEIGILSDKLNLMLVRMQQLLNSIKLKEKQKRKMEQSFLQAQINPHFMYNTLFSVKCMVDMGRSTEASQMLYSFIQILRSTLSNPDEFVTLKQELAVLKQYAEIQRYRYDNGFEVFFECEEEIEEKRIPKLLLQPLLENAIFHGVELRKNDGMIVVVARKAGEDVVVTVEDNGIGIAQTLLEQILAGKLSGNQEHVGIYNVKERIQLYFGERYGMQIESQQWKGTKIILTFPVVD